jgi:hypothetical protein
MGRKGKAFRREGDKFLVGGQESGVEGQNASW